MGIKVRHGGGGAEKAGDVSSGDVPVGGGIERSCGFSVGMEGA